jgi:hypothetical protein
VQKDGWDAAMTQAQERGRSFKNDWQQLTGRKWGSEIGQSWRPLGWDDELLADETSEDDITALRDALREAERASAFDEGALAALRADIEAQADRETAAKAAADVEATALAQLRAAESRRGDLPVPEESGHDLPCPHCGAFVRIDRKDAATTQLIKAEESRHSKTDIQKMRTDIAEADGDLANKRSAYTGAKAKALAAAMELTNSFTAQAKLEEAAKSKGAKTSVESAQAAYDAARNRVASKFAYLDAAAKHEAILGNASIQAVLAPDGLRATALARGLEAFNREHLAPLCTAAGFPEVEVGPDLTITWAGRPWQWLSGGEKWITSAILQIAVARADGSQMVILDGADICDAGNRNALFALLPEIGIEALVGMTYNKPAQVPDLAGAGLGDRFWMRDGTAEEIAR